MKKGQKIDFIYDCEDDCIVSDEIVELSKWIYKYFKHVNTDNVEFKKGDYLISNIIINNEFNICQFTIKNINN